MKLQDILYGLHFETIKGKLEEDITDIAYDSRQAGPGMIFVCMVGAVTDGHHYAAGAYENGVRVFICERKLEIEHRDGVTILQVSDARAALAVLSENFFGHPARRVKLIGITGTKGKTSISFMLKSIFETAGKKVGIIGSTGCIYGDQKIKLPNTTPESYELHKMFYLMAEAGCEYIVLEATSQGFYLRRLVGVEFDVALFTNLSPDHISVIEHSSFEHYTQCKKMIFDQAKICFVNRDTEYFNGITAGVQCPIVTYGKGNENPYYASQIHCHLTDKKMAVDFLCHTPEWEKPIRVNIPGVFSAYNALAAVCVADYLGIDREAIKTGIYNTVVKGRMEPLDVPAPYTVLIDFAHNALSVVNLMETAKKYNPNRIVCVFGLEGNRAHIRRFDSGEILGHYADLTIVTSASPRTDDPDAIINDIVTGIERANGKYIAIRDRKEAIIYALDHAQPGDLLLLVGKGSVLYEEVMGENIHFDEREIVAQYFSSAP